MLIIKQHLTQGFDERSNKSILVLASSRPLIKRMNPGKVTVV